jgi:amino acid permease
MLRGSLISVVLALVPVALAFAPSQTAQWTRVTSAPTFAKSTVNLATPSMGLQPLYMTAAVSEGDEGEENGTDTIPPGDASVTELCFNLVKGIVGAGVLSLPAGIAAFASAPSAVVPAVALIAIVGALSGYGFALIGRCCAYTNTKSYRDAWSATVGEKSSWLPAVSVTFKTFAAVLAYSMILGDTFVSLFATAGMTVAKLPTLLGLTGGVLLPLCLLKNLSSLAPFSLVGSLGMLYTAVAMSLRFIGKSYVAPAGKFAADCAPALRPAFGSVGAEGILTPSAAILVGMLSTAFMAHFNAPKVRNAVWFCSCSH